MKILHPSLRLLLVAASLIVTACDQKAPPAPVKASFEQAALKAGCTWDCPKCEGAQPCPLRPCILICPKDTTQCGNTFCTNGDTCCNASCGICTPRGGTCTQQTCAAAK